MVKTYECPDLETYGLDEDAPLENFPLFLFVFILFHIYNCLVFFAVIPFFFLKSLAPVLLYFPTLVPNVASCSNSSYRA